MITQGSPMKSIPTIGIAMNSSIGSALLRYARLERCEFGVDLVRRAEFGDLLFERLGRLTEAGRIRAALGKIDPAFEHIEAGKGVGDLRAVVHLAQLGAVVRALEPSDDRILAGAGLAQL